MPEDIHLNTSIPEEYRGLRLDFALAKCFPEHSRSRLTQWIRDKQVLVNGAFYEPKSKVQGGEKIIIAATLVAQQSNDPEPIPLNIIFEDEHILVINKPAGLVVHPAAGNPNNTLLNALLYHAPSLQHLPRAGIIHRLDKDTTGLMVIAKSLIAHTALVAAMQKREIQREYAALIAGEMISGGRVDAPIGRHPAHRTKMAVIHSGKHAITHYRCAKRYSGFTLLDIRLETGRTHQIRVHLSHIGYPIVGDALYGWRYRVPAKSSLELQDKIRNFKRQALHAKKLSFTHPVNQEHLVFEAALPEDYKALVNVITEYSHSR